MAVFLEKAGKKNAPVYRYKVHVRTSEGGPIVISGPSTTEYCTALVTQ